MGVLTQPETGSAELLKRTRTRCTTCHEPCPGEVWRIGSDPQEVHLKKFCAEHGEHSVCLSSDARFYWLAQGDPANAAAGDCCDSCGCGNPGTLGKNAPGRKEGPFEKLSTCLALIEIVDSCNLSCPTCYADSPLGQGRKVDARPLAEIQGRIQGVIDRKGPIEILQLSGGEPTLHPEFFELVEWVHANPGIDYLLINTNGIRLARDAEFLERLKGAMEYGHIQTYLQFDGVSEPSQQILRGADLRELKTQAIERCGEINLPITLAMTVIPENLGELWQAIEFGLQYPHVRGISFQPMFTSGRLPGSGESGRRLNTADIILSAVEGSSGTLKFEDFTPLPCGDPNCATIGYLLKIDGEVRSVSDFIDFADVQDFLRDKVRYSLEDLSECGCDNQPLGEILREFELDETHTFRLFVKPFMDAHSWDDDRIDRCCTHVIRPDGKLDSFCRYYSGFADCAPSP